jgi:hypothetical protein
MDDSQPPETITDSAPQDAGASQSSPAPKVPSHWASLQSPEDIRKALKDLMGMVLAKKIEPSQAKEVRANLTDQLRFALARERKEKPSRKPSAHSGQAFQDLEATEALAIEIAHREIIRLSGQEKLTRAETKQLHTYITMINAAKVLSMREFEMQRRLGKPDLDKAKAIAQAIVPPELTPDKK